MNKARFEKNRLFLREHHPELADRLFSSFPERAFVLKRSRAQPPVPLSLKTGAAVHCLDDPEAEAFCAFNSMTYDVLPRIVIFYGVGMGYALTAFCNVAKPQTRCLILVESNLELFSLALYHIDLAALSCRYDLYLIIGTPLLESQNRLQRILTASPVCFGLYSLVQLQTPGAFALQREFYEALLMFVARIPSIFKQQLGDPLDVLLGFRNYFKQLPEILNRPVVRALPFCKGKLGILVAAGPSLEKAMPFLKTNLHKAIVVAVDSALHPLLKQGIIPDAMVCSERMPEMIRYFEKSPVAALGIPVFTAPVMAENVVEKIKNRQIILYRRDALGRLLDASGLAEVYRIADHGNNVAQHAFQVLSALGCSNIVLVGQDLCFDLESGASHHRDKSEVYKPLPDLGQAKAEELLDVFGNCGERVTTTILWHRVKQGLEQQIAAYSGMVYNLSIDGSGAVLKGVTVISPDDFNAIFESKQTLEKTVSLYDALCANVWPENQNARTSLDETLQSLCHLLSETIAKLVLLERVRTEYEICEEEQRKYELLLRFRQEKEVIIMMLQDNTVLMDLWVPYHVLCDMAVLALDGEDIDFNTEANEALSKKTRSQKQAYYLFEWLRLTRNIFSELELLFLNRCSPKIEY